MATHQYAADLASHDASSREEQMQEQRYSPNNAALAGPGTSRANRRLQLRKNGFRGRAVQEHRDITPNRPSSAGWSPAVNDIATLLDGSSDSKMHDRYEMDARRSSSNILQEVNNSSFRRKGHGRTRMDPLVSIFHDENAEAEGDAYDTSREAALWQLESSPACLPPDAPNLTKTKKKQQQQRSSTDMVRDAMLEEKDHYIEHLESQLAATQTQLSSVTSPTVTQARSLKMRALNSQIRTLQDELAEWESRYHERIQEEYDDRNKVETSLKSRVRVLEQDVEAYAQNARDLQHQLEQTRNSLSAAESTSMELEKRLETFANIVATSPVKSEFNFTPFSETRRGHARRQSALPRFPTTGSLQPPHNNRWSMPAPVPASQTSQIQEELTPEPSKSGEPSPVLPSAALRSQSPLHDSEASTPSHPIVTNEVDFAYAYADGASKRDSMLSSASSRLSWSFADGAPGDGPTCPSSGRARPSRRMRRFHASVMPKPLILSGTTQMNAMAMPATAPPLEDHESPPAFPFPVIDAVPRRSSFDDSPLVTGRRRAHTIADGLTRADFGDLSPMHGAVDSPAPAPPSSSSSQKTGEGTLDFSSPDLGTAESTPRDYSSLGSAIGRNLFEELRRARTIDSATTSSDAVPGSSPPSLKAAFASSSKNMFVHQSPSQLRQRRIIHHRSISEQTALPMRSRSRTVMGLPSLTQSISSRSTRSRASTRSQPASSGNKIVTIFSDLYHHPFLLARRSFLRGERLMLVSNGVGKLQWWLLSFLLGPMVCRRLLSSAQPLLFSPRSFSVKAWRRECRRRRKSGSSMFTEHSIECPCRRAEDGSSGKGKGLLERHSPWLWIKFSLTLAFAIGAAIKDGPGSLLGSEWGVDERECTCSASENAVEVEDVVEAAGGIETIEANATIGTKETEEVRLAAKRPIVERSDSQRSLADELEEAGYDESEHEDEHEHDE